jgi:hypothetical protein
MEDNLLINMWCLDVNQLGDVFEDAEAKRYIFPEETSIEVESDLFTVGSLNWQHRERKATVTDICVENSFKGGSVTDLTFVHAADSLLYWHHLAEIEARITLQECSLDRLNLII